MESQIAAPAPSRTCGLTGFLVMPLQLIADRLAVERGGRVLFSDLSFTVLAGEAMMLTGPNGAGKTTLLRALAGFCGVDKARKNMVEFLIVLSVG